MLAWIRRAWRRGKFVARRRELGRDLDDEVAFHLAMRAAKNRAAGVAQEEAAYAARRQFGNVTGVKEKSMSWVSPALRY